MPLMGESVMVRPTKDCCRGELLVLGVRFILLFNPWLTTKFSRFCLVVLSIKLGMIMDCMPWLTGMVRGCPELSTSDIVWGVAICTIFVFVC